MISSSTFVDAMMEGFQVIDRDFRYLYVNEAAATHGRSTPEALMGRTMPECYPGIEQTEMFGLLQQCMDGGGPQTMRNQFAYDDGSMRWFELRIMPVDEGVLILSFDVTDSVETEQELRRTARAARALSLCNRTLVRATHEDRFVRDISRLLCDDAGYQAAWVGIRNSELEIDWHSRSVHNVKAPPLPDDHEVVAIINSILNGDPVTPRPVPIGDWEEARELGIATLVALPVLGPTDLLGIIVLAAHDEAAFDGHEADFVEEIAWDLGFGLHTMRLNAGFESERSDHQRTKREHSTLVSNLPGLAYRCLNDEPWTILSVSDGAYALTGYTRDHLLDPENGGFEAMIHPDDVARVHEEVDAAVREGRRFTVEYRLRHSDGSLRWVSERGVAVQDGDDVVLEGFITDVTARREAADAEHLLNVRLLELADTVQRIASADGFGEITNIVTEAARRLLGADRSAVAARRGSTCRFVAENGDDTALRGRTLALEQCVAGWAILNEEPAIVPDLRDDERAPADIYAPLHVTSMVAVPIGRAPATASLAVYYDEYHHTTVDDVEMLQALADSAAVAIDNVRAFREVKEREALVEAVLRALPSAIFIWRHDTGVFTLTQVNDAATRLVGGAVELVGQTPEALEFLFPGCGAYLQRCLTSERLHLTEVESDIGDETSFYELTFGFVPGGLVVMRADDVTEQRLMERRTRASQRLEAVGQLAAGVAHDFNNLLTVINSYTELSLDNIEGLEPTESFLREVLEAGQRAAGLTAQLLAFSRRQMLAPEALSVNAVVESVDPMLRRLLSASIDIRLHLELEIGTIKVDPAQLEQVIVNLAINAADAMQQGGTLRIRTQNVVLDDDFDWGDNEKARPGDYVMLSISDTGVGMTPETLDKVFEPFFTTKHFGRGTGLGLAMVHGVVTQSGGQLRVASEPSVGTTFEIYLPRVDVERVDFQDDSTPTGELIGLETILVAEDERALRELLERVLTQAGYAVLAAANGEEALELVAAQEFDCDLLVTDVVMPKMGGRDLADKLIVDQPEVKVLYISGYTDDAVLQHGVSDEGTNFLGKPFSARELLRKVRRVLDE